MNSQISALIDEIAKLPNDWHKAGTVSLKVLQKIAQYADQLGTIHNSVETGSGKTTLLFSHISSNHLVFAKDMGTGSITQVKASPLFNAKNVTFVEGSTQVTVPNHRFNHKVQIALIDGPHGYPFPDIEYYYFCPLLETGGYLVIDDIKIPSIKRMFDIIKSDAMFSLVEVVDNNTAFFRRSEATLIDPQDDDWTLQGFNKPYAEIILSTSRSPYRGTLTSLTRIMPDNLKRLIPLRLKRLVYKFM